MHSFRGPVLYHGSKHACCMQAYVLLATLDLQAAGSQLTHWAVPPQ